MTQADLFNTRQGVPITLTIAGSDSSGGAGIQADLKTFSALETFGTSALTAVTAQNTTSVTQIFELPPEMVYNQIKAVALDLEIRSFKTGMLFSEAIIDSVAGAIREFGLSNYVLDPVMVAKGGAVLLKKGAKEALIKKLIPLANIITPNIPEAEALADTKIVNETTIKEASKKILKMGPECVILKGGHLENDPVDWVNIQGKIFAMPQKRINTKNTHGSGCTFSSAIVAYIARGIDPEQAIWNAKSFIHKAIEKSIDIGKGHGPLHHFHLWYNY